MNHHLLDTRLRYVAGGVAALGLVALVFGLATAPERAWLNLLLCSFYFLGLGVSGALFVAIHYIARAGWPVVLRRIPEALTAFIPVGGALVLIVFLGGHSIYEWTHREAVATDSVLQAKSAFLNPAGFLIRLVIYVFLWCALARKLVRHSRTQDADGELSHTRKNVATSAVFAAVFAVTFTLASIDWLMSLEPHWYSTLFPWYVFVGTLVNATVVVMLFAIHFRARGYLTEVGEHHLHDLGKYIFGFSFFWGYLWFSQYMLIWYSNIPEETVYYIGREGHGWFLLFLASPLINAVIPFLALLPAACKKRPAVVVPVCVLLLIGHWLDLYLMIMPSFMKDGPRFGLLEIGIFAGVAAAFLLTFDAAFRRASAVPRNDPYLIESLHYHA